MKIDDYSIWGVAGNTSTSAAQENKNTSENQISFADQLSMVLKQALIEATSTDKSKEEIREKQGNELEEELAGNNGIFINNQVAANAALAGTGAPLAQQQSVSALDDLLNIMEEFEAALADSSKSLKDISPLVDDMQAQAQRLQNSLANVDRSLLPLANQIISQAQIESIKFQRGDYIE